VDDRLQQASPLVRREGIGKRSSTSCAATPTGAKAASGRSGWTPEWFVPTSTPAGARHQPPADIDADVLVVRELAVGARAALAFVEYPNSPEARPPPRTC
jgi:hypothetical protein